MNRAKHTLLALIAGIVFALVPSVVAGAIDATPTADEYWLKDTSIKISAYGRVSDGTNLRYIELFNDSDGLIDVHDWKITGVFSNGTRSELPVTALDTGGLVPKAHAVVQIADLVGHASFSGGPWTPAPTKATQLTSVEISSQTDGWKTDIYVLKTSGSGATLKYDDFWVRSQISGESYTSTLSSFTAVTPVALHDDGLYEVPVSFPGRIVEVYPYSSDCAPDDTSVLCGDYIKIRLDNPSVDISQYVLRTDSNSSTRTTSNTFYLDNLSSDGYLTIAQDEDGKRLSLTNSGGYVWIEDLYGLKTYSETMTNYASAGSSEQGFSWMLGDDSVWQWSTTPEPFSANKITAPIEEVTTCPTGKYLNPDTGRCRTLEEAVNALAACPEGQERNAMTNRCRAKVTTAVAVLASCGEGQERNPATNRCRSIASAVAELIPCNDGYERNPETNRCRKVAGISTSAGTSPAQLVESAKGSTWNTWTWSLVAVAAAGAIGYGVYEWRHELFGFGRTIATKFGKK